MSSNFYSVGLNHVGAYQVSGTPFLSGSQLPASPGDSIRFQFPKVTKKIIFKSNFNHVTRVHFAPWNPGDFNYTGGAEPDNYLELDPGHTIEIDVKCAEVFVSSGHAGANADDVQIYAELTNIPASRMFSLDGLEGVTE